MSSLLEYECGHLRSRLLEPMLARMDAYSHKNNNNVPYQFHSYDQTNYSVLNFQESLSRTIEVEKRLNSLQICTAHWCT